MDVFKTIDIEMVIQGRKWKFPVHCSRMTDGMEIYKFYPKGGVVIIACNRPQIRKHSALKRRVPDFWLIHNVRHQTWGWETYFREIGELVCALLDGGS